MTCDGGERGGSFPTACGRDTVHPSHPLGRSPGRREIERLRAEVDKIDRTIDRIALVGVCAIVALFVVLLLATA